MCKFKVGDRVVVEGGEEGCVFHIRESRIKDDYFISVMFTEANVGYFYGHEIRLAGPYAELHMVAREICGGVRDV